MPAAQRKPKFTAWSYSRWAVYDTCPFKAYNQFHLKLGGQKNAAMDRGTEVHKDGELYVKGRLGRLPKAFKAFAPQMKWLRENEAIAEEQWTATKNFSGWTGWFSEDAWCRIKIDVHLELEGDILFVGDYKTGGVWGGGYESQMSLYGLAGLKKYPNVHQVQTDLWFVDSGDIVTEVYHREQERALEKQWLRATKAMLTDTSYQPKPGNHCSRCPFSKSKGGTCKY